MAQSADHKDLDEDSSLDNVLKNMGFEEMLEKQLSRLDKLYFDCGVHELNKFTKKCDSQSDNSETNIFKGMSKEDGGINLLNEKCKEHYIAYAESKSKEDRRKADEILIGAAWEIAKDESTKHSAKAKAWAYFIVISLKMKMIAEKLYTKFASRSRSAVDACISLFGKIFETIVEFLEQCERIERNRIVYLAGNCIG
ncbi:hypothetical protein C0J52_27338 [Blattella germanica]|nr:hypothetical protein C0J52_27338 [Blattella germanica]